MPVACQFFLEKLIESKNIQVSRRRAESKQEYLIWRRRLADALARHAAESEVAKSEQVRFGMRYVIDGIIHAPDGRTPSIRSVWFVEQGRGDVGTVVLIHRGGEGYEVEFVALAGETIAVVALEASQVRPIRHRKVAHARALETYAAA
ncbi:MAG: DUF6883 domain-containing protein [Chloroflexota bacterium]